MKRYLLILILYLTVATAFAYEGTRSAYAQQLLNLNDINRIIDSIAQNNQADNRPVIGILGNLDNGENSVTDSYMKAVTTAGAVAVILPATDNVTTNMRQLDLVDGILLTGGADIHSLIYGEEPIPEQGRVNLWRDLSEIAMLRLAMKRRMPVLGICHGLQLINVALGGTLIQDIPAAGFTVQHRQAAPGDVATHSINTEPGSRMRQLLGEKTAVNSRHHQCIGRLANGLKVTARASDGVIEAIEGENIVATQFHPENLIYANPRMLDIFKDFTTRAAEYHKNIKR